MDGIDQTKVKLTHIEQTMRYPFNINLNINTKIRTEKWAQCVRWWGCASRKGRMKEGD
jgi:hypothetical protein